MGTAISCQCLDASKSENGLEIVATQQTEGNEGDNTAKTTVLSGGATYTGDFKNGLKHGFGVLVRPCGSKYVGYFKDGVAEGQGKFIHPSGDTYEGQWKNSKAHGKGRFTHADGSYYDGQTLNPKP
ncbi:MORN repeat-containing protein, putative [Eimeria necatrix]|uniref:MORN repeat-containing protein, putative n=1 Tax=Eimeria necatrix TaxID=51315 RepID=U6MNG4_9EIME|nr:MORN repeat-containing protein, putative [Eimeria necatrix]CDJ65536.1 MORN repeat-containing protein, putative [Eimeria necatrix]